MKGSVGRRPPALPICTRKMNLQMNSENKYVEREWPPLLVTRKRAFMQTHCASKLFKVLLLIILILTSIALPTLLYKVVAALLIPAGTWIVDDKRTDPETRAQGDRLTWNEVVIRSYTVCTDGREILPRNWNGTALWPQNQKDCAKSSLSAETFDNEGKSWKKSWKSRPTPTVWSLPRSHMPERDIWFEHCFV